PLLTQRRSCRQPEDNGENSSEKEEQTPEGHLVGRSGSDIASQRDDNQDRHDEEADDARADPAQDAEPQGDLPGAGLVVFALDGLVEFIKRVLDSHGTGRLWRGWVAPGWLGLDGFPGRRGLFGWRLRADGDDDD